MLAVNSSVLAGTVHTTCYDPLPNGASSVGIQYCITLQGAVFGGTVHFVGRPQGFTPRYVSVHTSPGESVEEVVQRLADAIDESSWCKAHAEGATLKHVAGVIGFHAFAGTETGLGIPKPPLSLSGNYDAKADRVALRWLNPPGDYDSIIGCGGNVAPGATGCSVSAKGRNPAAAFTLVGVRAEAPSSYALITVSENSQEEIECIPFYNGVTPNWSSWSTSSKPSAAKFEQGVKAGVDLAELQRLPRRINGPDDKPFFQLVRTSDATVQAGVWREFLGLQPEHKYRVYVRLNTLEMDKSTNDWSLSFHVAGNAKGVTEFTTDQLAGKSSLPDGSKGAAAARIALYGPGKTTKGQWVTNTVDITLPAGVDTITTWLRHSGQDSTGIGMDWIKVEDLSYDAK